MNKILKRDIGLLDKQISRATIYGLGTSFGIAAAMMSEHFSNDRSKMVVGLAISICCVKFFQTMGDMDYMRWRIREWIKCM